LWADAADADALALAVFKGLTGRSTLTPESVTGTKSFKELDLAKCRAQFDKLDGDEAALLAAMVSDVTNKESPLRGPLVMTGGPQDFTGEVGKLRTEIKQAGTACIANALFGPWKYEEGHPLGFDPLMEREHGYLASKPEGDARRVPGAVLLAVTALRWLPLYPVSRRRRVSNAVFRDPLLEEMSWPVWEAPLEISSVVSLLSVRREWQGGLPPFGGIIGEFAAIRKETGKPGSRYAVLRPARRLR
jgi:hypothetical protein